ncbi:helix-turn-helix domain-containing protein [Streptomyces hainanensis]|uniref:XRE family transcriptional regulator n=1 Tax=Streptomyces hainanensis TaxID=402648 RepID=A0A4R4TI80_9ACTN|nr:helix-turn-helix transcriptional regulator [Streptomyces hainanensis]TDC77508.1 XRE family transcriptional regulator [Streptomyces hainanensis]
MANTPQPNHALQGAREHRRLTQEDIARELTQLGHQLDDRGFSPQITVSARQYRKWEAGEATPRAETRKLLAVYFGVPLAELGFSVDTAPARVVAGVDHPALPQQQMTIDRAADLPWRNELPKQWAVEMLTRRGFTAVTGAALTTPVWRLLDQPHPLLFAAGAGGRVDEPLVALVEDTAARAQSLDDQEGAAARGFVIDQFTVVARMLQRDRYDTATGRRLATACARLAQTAGWMAHEARQDPEAQRWYLIALRVAHASDNRALMASVLGLMTTQAATLGLTAESMQLAAAAQETASATPATVRALVHARSGLAYAAAGDLAGFRRARDETLALLDNATSAAEPPPVWASYVTATELDAIAGRGLVDLAHRIGVSVRQRRLVAEAEPLLSPRAHDNAPESRRSSVRHGAWLALAQARIGDLDQAVDSGQRALSRLPDITSARIIGLFSELRTELASRRRDPTVQPFVLQLGQLDRRP